MQQLGYVVVNGETILLLVRREKYGVALKLRASGVNGRHMEDEENGLNELPELVEQLKSGRVIHV